MDAQAFAIFHNERFIKMTEKGYSKDEAKNIIGVGTTKLYQLINSGALRAHKIGKRTIILRSDLEDFLSNLESYPSQKKEG